MPSPWPALHAAYPGPGGGKAALRRAIAAEIPGGAALLDAHALANSAPLRPSPTEAAPILDAIAVALDACADAPHAKPLGQAAAFLRQATSPHGPSSTAAPGSVPMAAVLDKLRAARDLAADAILSRYSTD